MVQRTRHLGPVAANYSDYLYNRQFKRGLSGRRGQRRGARTVTRRLRRVHERDAAREIAAELNDTTPDMPHVAMPTQSHE